MAKHYLVPNWSSITFMRTSEEVSPAREHLRQLRDSKHVMRVPTVRLSAERRARSQHNTTPCTTLHAVARSCIHVWRKSPCKLHEIVCGAIAQLLRASLLSPYPCAPISAEAHVSQSHETVMQLRKCILLSTQKLHALVLKNQRAYLIGYVRLPKRRITR